MSKMFQITVTKH